MRPWTSSTYRVLAVCALLAGCELDVHIADGSGKDAASADDDSAVGQEDGAVANPGGGTGGGGAAGGGAAGGGAGGGGSATDGGGSGTGDAGKPTGIADASADTDPPQTDPCDCPLELYVPVCGVDGVSYDATCGRQCVPVRIACDGECPCANTGSGLRWYESCGDPVCGISPDPFNSPSIPDCTSEELGAACDSENARCDGVAGCGVSWICAKSDPTMRPGGCPISRARYKQDIAYLGERELREFHEQLMRMPLASYQYKHAQGAGPQLGFIIEDIEPSVAVSGDHVNMYGYLSMAVAAIKVQQRQIEDLKREVRRLRKR